MAALVLAAGESRRLGEPKQMVRLGGTWGEERLLERSVRIAREAGCSPVVVVLGAEAETIQGACRLGDAEVLLNEDWREGMASSVRAGVEALRGRTDAMVLMTCDQPAVTADHLRELMLAGDEVVGSGYAERVGVPAFFAASMFEQLNALEGDQGARRLLQGARKIDLPGGEVDVDTREMLQAARQQFA